MSDLGDRKNAGKARFDLLPWADVAVADHEHTVGDAFEALKVWWTGRPFALKFALPRRQVRGVAAVLAYGSTKYADRNWERGQKFSTLFASAARHADAWASGEHIDPESGLAHESLFWANVMFAVTLTGRGRTDLDDRPEPSPKTVAGLDQMQALVAQLTGETPVSGAGLSDPKNGKGSN
jgi:hypothetical protein